MYFQIYITFVDLLCYAKTLFSCCIHNILFPLIICKHLNTACWFTQECCCWPLIYQSSQKRIFFLKASSPHSHSFKHDRVWNYDSKDNRAGLNDENIASTRFEKKKPKTNHTSRRHTQSYTNTQMIHIVLSQFTAPVPALLAVGLGVIICQNSKTAESSKPQASGAHVTRPDWHLCLSLLQSVAKCILRHPPAEI